jgi:hypothetical protein
VPGVQRDPGQEQRRQHHHAQRPEVVDQVGLHRRRGAQRHEQQEVKAEQAVDADQQRGQRHPPLAQAETRQRQGDQAAHQQAQAGEQERGQVGQFHAQRGQRAPQGDGGQGQQVGFHAASIST